MSLHFKANADGSVTVSSGNDIVRISIVDGGLVASVGPSPAVAAGLPPSIPPTPPDLPPPPPGLIVALTDFLRDTISDDHAGQRPAARDLFVAVDTQEYVDIVELNTIAKARGNMSLHLVVHGVDRGSERDVPDVFQGG
jgi:hypothetical protein